MNERILIVDDDEDALEVLKTILEYGGYEVHSFSNGATAYAKIREIDPALAILDIMMPGMDGTQVCEAIKKDPATHDIPVIILTAKDSGDDVERALSKGADWYIAKPYDNKYLLEKVRFLLEKRGSGR